ncbi:hypothetical protein LPU83_2515 [Rhizobium favelukesii]|uniref:Uncharacterized protein n=1 Tax=Rhizobium favelukesii TaxID=348824 RepID=W6RBF1_9HYPH|nr:hypothetical protein LPU83_2515 [Rhizobium favelukesii]
MIGGPSSALPTSSSPYAYIAYWWTEDIENYGDAVRFRAKLRAEGGNKILLEEYEQICVQLEEELQSYFDAPQVDLPRRILSPTRCHERMMISVLMIPSLHATSGRPPLTRLKSHRRPVAKGRTR